MSAAEGLGAAVRRRWRAMWPVEKILADLAPVASPRALAAVLVALLRGDDGAGR